MRRFVLIVAVVLTAVGGVASIVSQAHAAPASSAPASVSWRSPASVSWRSPAYVPCGPICRMRDRYRDTPTGSVRPVCLANVGCFNPGYNGVGNNVGSGVSGGSSGIKCFGKYGEYNWFDLDIVQGCFLDR